MRANDPPSTQSNAPGSPRNAAPPAETPRTRVLCVDDSADMVRILARLVRAQPDLEEVGALTTAEGLATEVADRRADVVVLDLTMPGDSPLDSIREIARSAPSCRVIAFSGYDDPDTVEEALAAGAWELVSKHGEPTEIVKAIRRVHGAPARAPFGGTTR